MKYVLDIEKQRELLTTNSKKILDQTMIDVDEIVDELGLSRKEAKAFRQRCAAEIIYTDLKCQNDYLSRTEDKLAQKKIDRNKIDMAAANHAYQDHYKDIKHIEQLTNQKLEQKIKSRQNTNTGRKVQPSNH